MERVNGVSEDRKGQRGEKRERRGKDDVVGTMMQENEGTRRGKKRKRGK